MGRFSSIPLRAVAASLALALPVLAAAGAPADAARRPPGPKQAAPAARRRAHRPGAVPLAQGQARPGLRPADRARPRLHLADADGPPARRQGARLLLARTLVLEGARDGQGQLALVEHPPGRRAPAGRRLPAHAPDRAARDGGRRGQRHGHVRRLEGRRRRRALRAPGGQRKVIARGIAAPITAQSAALRDALHAARARPRRSRPRLAGSRPSHTRARAPCTDHLAPDAPGNVHAITVADTSVALAWDAATIPTAPSSRYAVYRNGVLLGQPTTTGFLARTSRPPRPTPSRSWPSTAAATARPTARSTARPWRRCPRPAPPTPTCSRRRARASTTCSGTTCRSPSSRRPTSTWAPTSRSSGRTTRS